MNNQTTTARYASAAAPGLGNERGLASAATRVLRGVPGAFTEQANDVMMAPDSPPLSIMARPSNSCSVMSTPYEDLSHNC